METPYARWIFYCAVTAACVMFGGGSDLTFHPHDYGTNLWWQLMNRTSQEEKKLNCYVCAQLPVATHNSGLHAGPITDDKQMCLYGLSTQPRLSVPPPRGCKWCKKDYSVLLRRGDAAKGLFGTMNCSFDADVLPFPPFPQTAWKISETISLEGAKPGSLRSCIFNNLGCYLGVTKFTPTTTRHRITLTALPAGVKRRPPTAKSGKTTQTVTTCFRRGASTSLIGRQETTLYSAIVPGSYGSRLMADWNFLCGTAEKSSWTISDALHELEELKRYADGATQRLTSLICFLGSLPGHDGTYR